MNESGIRFERKEGFAILYNSLVRDPRLSLKTKGLMAVIVSLPERWNYNVGGLATVCGVGRDAIRSSLNELEAAGYLTREQAHNEAGKFAGNIYVIHERSTTPVEDVRAPLPGFPTTVEPTAGEPSSGNPTLYKKERSSKEPDTPRKPPKGDVQADVLFDRFWAAYPRKVNKDRARRAWKKLRPDLALCRVMSAALAAQKASTEWTRDDGRYIPHAATWLNGRRWEDEVEPAAQAGAPPAPPAAPRKSHVEVINGEEVVVFD